MILPRTLDHVALQVPDFDARVKMLVEACEMRVIRRGTRYGTGQRMAMLGDGTGFKLELIEAPGIEEPTFEHLAFEVADADQAFSTMVDRGWAPKREPHDLRKARARTALLTDGRGLDVQVIAYDADSPDLEGRVGDTALVRKRAGPRPLGQEP